MQSSCASSAVRLISHWIMIHTHRYYLCGEIRKCILTCGWNRYTDVALKVMDQIQNTGSIDT